MSVYIIHMYYLTLTSVKVQQYFLWIAPWLWCKQFCYLRVKRTGESKDELGTSLFNNLLLLAGKKVYCVYGLFWLVLLPLQILHGKVILLCKHPDCWGTGHWFVILIYFISFLRFYLHDIDKTHVTSSLED